MFATILKSEHKHPTDHSCDLWHTCLVFVVCLFMCLSDSKALTDPRCACTPLHACDVTADFKATPLTHGALRGAKKKSIVNMLFAQKCLGMVKDSPRSENTSNYLSFKREFGVSEIIPGKIDDGIFDLLQSTSQFLFVNVQAWSQTTDNLEFNTNDKKLCLWHECVGSESSVTHSFCFKCNNLNMSCSFAQFCS